MLLQEVSGHIFDDEPCGTIPSISSDRQPKVRPCGSSGRTLGFSEDSGPFWTAGAASTSSSDGTENGLQVRKAPFAESSGSTPGEGNIGPVVSRVEKVSILTSSGIVFGPCSLETDSKGDFEGSDCELVGSVGMPLHTEAPDALSLLITATQLGSCCVPGSSGFCGAETEKGRQVVLPVWRAKRPSDKPGSP